MCRPRLCCRLTVAGILLSRVDSVEVSGYQNIQSRAGVGEAPCSFPHFLHCTDGLVTSDLGCPPSCRTVAIICPDHLSVSVPDAYPFTVALGPQKGPAPLEFQNKETAALHHLSGTSAWALTTGPVWRSHAVASSLSDFSSPDLGFLLSTPLAFLQSLEPPVCLASAELWPNWNHWERMRSWEGWLVVRAGQRVCF